jgi:hypothetical protein
MIVLAIAAAAAMALLRSGSESKPSEDWTPVEPS